MFFSKKDKLKKQANKIDRLITGLIIGGAVASMIGLSNKTRREKISETLTKQGGKIAEKGANAAKKGYSIFGKVIVGALKIFSKK